MFIAFIGLVIAGLGFVPLGLVAAVPRWRSEPVAWSTGCAVAAYVLVYLAGQIRVVTGPGLLPNLAFMLGLLVALSPILILRRRNRQGIFHMRLASVLPVAIVLPVGLRAMTFRDRTERLEGAVRAQNLPEVRRLLKGGADPDCFDVGHCAIDLAVEAEDWTLVDVLIRYGATNSEYHEDPDGEGKATSAARKLEAKGQRELARRLRANGP